MSILISLLVARKLEAQSNDKSTDRTYESELLAYKQSIKYKDLEAERIANVQSQARSLVGRWGGQCVPFARKFAGLTREELSGYARNFKTTSDIPTIGGIVKTNESNAGHVAVIIGIAEDTITVVESNYIRGGIVGIREIPRTSDKILGYWERR